MIYKEVILAQSTFNWQARIYHEDVDTMAIVYYANYLKYLERARSEWLRALAIDQKELHRQWGIWFVVKTISLDYKSSAKLDDLIDITVSIKSQTKTSLLIEQHVFREGQLLLSGNILLVCVSDRNHMGQSTPLKPAPIPDFLIDTWKDYL